MPYKSIEDIPARTSAASASYGIAFGETKDVASITLSPVNESWFISSTFTAVGISFFSFCRPSLGLTSTILTLDGKVAPLSFSGNYRIT